MRLNLESVREATQLKQVGVILPRFDVATMQQQGKDNPRWIHIGAGNLFRIFPARIADDCLAHGQFWPIVGVLPMDPGPKQVLVDHDLITLAVTLHETGEQTLRAIAGMSELLATRNDTDFARFELLMTTPSVTVVSFTITEKGYNITTSSGELTEQVTQALASDPRSYQTDTMALVTSALLKRFEAGAWPISLVSMDNFSHNGDKLRDSVLTIAQGWVDAGSAPADFVAWVGDQHQVAFPITCIDKITPRSSVQVAEHLKGLGFEDMDVHDPTRAPIAGFVNAEGPEYLIIEDKFAAERPPFEEYGTSVVDRQVCDKFERMKVTTCLNPLHTALAVSGCLLRIPTIDQTMRDPGLSALVHRLGWDEGMPVVVSPGIIDPKDFLNEVLEVRLPNPYLPDAPARIAMDTSQKIPIRFGQTILSYQERGMDLGKLSAIPLVFALWCRYLMGVADDGKPFEPSFDPLLDELQDHLAPITVGSDPSAETIHQALKPILSNSRIFGVDLYTTPLGGRVEELFAQLVAGPGTVQDTIKKEMHIQ